MKKIRTRIKNYLYSKVGPGYMDEELFRFLPSDLDVLIDIGAHTGSFSKLFHSKVKTSRTFLFEPIPEYYQKINTDPYFSKCKIYNAAVSSQSGTAEFSVNELPETSSLLNFDSALKETEGLNKKAERSIKVRTIRLSDVIKEHDLKEIDFMKIDVQGSEMDVLLGIGDELDKVKRILTEVSFKPIYKDSATFDKVRQYLSDHNFILIQLIPVYRGTNDELLQCDALFVNQNYL